MLIEIKIDITSLKRTAAFLELGAAVWYIQGKEASIKTTQKPMSCFYIRGIKIIWSCKKVMFSTTTTTIIIPYFTKQYTYMMTSDSFRIKSLAPWLEKIFGLVNLLIIKDFKDTENSRKDCHYIIHLVLGNPSFPSNRRPLNCSTLTSLPISFHMKYTRYSVNYPVPKTQPSWLQGTEFLLVYWIRYVNTWFFVG